VTVGRVVIEADTAEAAREKVERKGYMVLEVNRDDSSQTVSF
jgi:type II secretory pathway component PulF